MAGVLGCLKVWHQGLDDYRQLALASGIFLGPYTVWHVRRRWRLHQHDYIHFDAQGVKYQNNKELKVFTWTEIDTLWLDRYRYLMRLTLEAKSGDAFTLLLVHHGLETDEVKEFVRNKALIHGFKFKKFTALLYSRNLAK